MALYGEKEIFERHRHRYEVNNDYRTILEEQGMTMAGLSPDGHIVEMIELKDHPFFVGTQGHPELKSRPNRAHPLVPGLCESGGHVWEGEKSKEGPGMREQQQGTRIVPHLNMTTAGSAPW